jgi:hypothetical protein
MQMNPFLKIMTYKFSKYEKKKHNCIFNLKQIVVSVRAYVWIVLEKKRKGNLLINNKTPY